MLERDSKRKAIPCARCGADAQWQLWGRDVCNDCNGAYLGDARFTVSEVTKAVGPDAWTSPEMLAKVDAEYGRRMLAWLKEAKR